MPTRPKQSTAGQPDAVGDGYRLYRELAGWWPLISPPGEYVADAAAIERAFAATGTRGYRGRLPGEQTRGYGGRPPGEQTRGYGGRPPGEQQPVRTVLDLGSGGGNVALHLKHGRSMTLVDLSADMLAVSRRLNPDCEHVQGDMRSIRLGRTFDGVLMHDAVDYMTTEFDLALVIGTAFAHCRPGGLAVFMPDHTAEVFRPGTGTGGGQDDTGRQASFTERTTDPDPADNWILAEYEFTLRAADGSVQVVPEAHRLGAFRRATWLALLTAAGFSARVRPGTSAAGRPPRVMFVGRRPV